MSQQFSCPSCGLPVAFGSRFCGNCGTELNWPTQQPQPPLVYQHQQKRGTKMGIRKARTGVGCFVQTIGGILWLGCGLLMFIWTLYVLFSTFGIWTIFVGLLLAPITYVASIFIIWFSTGIFPMILLIPYLLSFIGMVIISLGGKISGED